MTAFEQGILDFVRQQHVGNLHAIISEIEGQWPQDDTPAEAEFKDGFEFARKMSQLDPSESARQEIRSLLRKDPHRGPG